MLPGPNGRLPVEISEMYPEAPIIRRHGEVNAWDNSEFRAAGFSEIVDDAAAVLDLLNAGRL